MQDRRDKPDTGNGGRKRLRTDQRRGSRSSQMNNNWRRTRGRQPYKDNESSVENPQSRNATSEKPPRIIRPMGFRKMEDLLKIDDKETLIFELKNEKNGFMKILEKTDISNDQIILIVRLLNNICESSFPANVVSLLEQALNSKFSDTIVTYISKLVIQDERNKKMNSYFWNEPERFWNNMLNIISKLHNLMPTSSCEVTKTILHAMKIYIPTITTVHSIATSKQTMDKMNKLYDLIQEKFEELEKNAKKSKATMEMDDEGEEPPDDYRTMSVYPSAGEIITPKDPFLRRNVIDKPYKTIHHYLDVQFRLLREDFLRPLRLGVCKYLSDNKAKLDDIKIHKQIRFLSPEIVNEQNCYRVQFEFNKKKIFQYENSRRFKFGSLLCFTNDNFKTVLFGKVVQRDIKDLQQSQIVVGFDDDILLPVHFYDTPFLMVESSVYFEPYFHVLNVLKNLEPINFPMEKYIIRIENDPKPPRYLINPFRQRLLVSCSVLSDRHVSNLNESQKIAFNAALTQEFVLIQGPPGTGKTFLGLKIAKNLLARKHIWYRNSPMLVICYTNHALDQFLDGILEVTENIFRVGGQSKNEKLNKYNIRKVRMVRSNQSVNQMRIQVRSYMQDINALNEIIKLIESNNAVMNFQHLYSVVNVSASSFFINASSDEFYKWLFTGFNEVQYQNLNRNSQHPLAPQNRNNTLQQVNMMKTDNQIPEVEDMSDHGEDKDDIFEDLKWESCTPLVSVNQLEKLLEVKERELYLLIEDDSMNFRDKLYQERFLRDDLRKTQYELDYLKMRLNEYALNPHRELNFADLENPRFMDPDSRWIFYFYCLNIYLEKIKETKEIIFKKFKEAYKIYREMQDMEDTQIMKTALVVGMTTTGAARLHHSIEALKSPIVIVEEAAEVLEAHIISALTPHCQHLILIGDHQQLKPSTSSFKIETKYLLGISLFERMVINKIQCHTLNVQHRMRPEISSLIRPAIYPVLDDHDSVKNRPPISGVEKCLYFIDHQEPEDLCYDNSKKNVHEATFLINFARHLILNNYKPENIVILAAYLGQMFEMQRLKKNKGMLLNDVRIAVLDNYQGEESDIILLSLVRNNKDKKIGFLKLENRVCVALSRARNGFYIMGNMTHLCESSDIWPKIKEVLEQQEAIGSFLTLRCQVHPYKITQVKEANDFNKFPEGGCDLLCNEFLRCGHFCKSLCHIADRDHNNYKCKEKCTKVLCDDNTHICQHLCFEDCGPCNYPVERSLSCGHTVTIHCHIDPDLYKCNILVHTTLPCGHKTDKPCAKDIDKFPCPHPCENRLERCGHACMRNCHIRDDPDHLEYKCNKECGKYRKECSLKEQASHICRKYCFEECEVCDISVKKRRTRCTHFYTVPCNVNVDELECHKPCTKTLPCGHICKNKCYEPCGKCQKMVEKIVPDCNHKVYTRCSEEPVRQMCQQKCPRLLACGHACDKKCAEECNPKCTVLTECSKPSNCGHIVTKIPCYLMNTANTDELLPHCNEKCDIVLQCDHKCSGTCGECSQGRMHKRCMEQCKVPLICNHECPIPCRQACQPCKKKCTYKCEHSRCSRNCGEVCIKCTERCGRHCEHQKCTKKCWELCNVPPCNQPCKKRLRKCGHYCVGFCGEICPKLCRICDKDELTEIFFGTEDEENALYVMLEDCQHVFESTSLDAFFSQDDGSITVKVCPKCKTTVRNSRRYSQYIKLMLKDLAAVKEKTSGEEKEIMNARASILVASTECKRKLLQVDFLIAKTDLLEILGVLHNRIQTSRQVNKQRRRQIIHKINLNAIDAKIRIIQKIADILDEMLSCDVQTIKIVSLIINTLRREEDTITDQEINDIYKELDRLIRATQFEKIKRCVSGANSSIKEQVNKIEHLLYANKQYTSDSDNLLKKELEELKKMTPSNIPITDLERREIVKAMKLNPGHWFKCKNGHPYVIGDCGGAMVVSTCNECGVPIGGRDHQLLHGQFAPEMDGARHAAWSEAANMQNYRF